MQALSQQLSQFLNSSPTPFHATQTIKNRLQSKGFIALDESASWDLIEGKRYFVTRNDSSIIAFNFSKALKSGWHIVGAHTDSPALKIKPNANLQQAGVNQVALEVYGGALLNPWFDRDLSLAGRVSFMDKEGMIKDVMIDFKRPIAIIPSLAIHLDNNANKERAINEQKHLPAVIGLKKEQSFHDLLESEISDKTLDKILGYDLFLYDTQSAGTLGVDSELFVSARLDNLLSCFCGLEALIEADESSPSLITFHDHEEVGSNSYHGAQSNFLESVLERISQSREHFSQVMTNSMMVSTDNAHAWHPNYQDVHEPEHAPIIGEGIAIKHHANQSYATDSVTTANFLKYAHKVKINTQDYVVRSDMRCGSTIGPITATKLGLKTIDIGIPTWAMHSIRETAALKDIEDMMKVLTAFFNR